MVAQLVQEHQYRHASVIEEVSQRWRHSQTLTSPLLTIPYRRFWKDDNGKVHTQLNKAPFLPDNFKVVGKLVPGFFICVVALTRLRLIIFWRGGIILD